MVLNLPSSPSEKSKQPHHVSPTTGAGPTAEVLRGWSLISDSQFPFPSSPPNITVVRDYISPLSLSPARSVPGTGVDFGKYELFFGSVGPSLTPNYQLSQNGLIPANADSLRLLLSAAVLGEVPQHLFEVQINGRSTSLRAGPGFGSGILDADVSAYAGQEVKLEFVFGRSFSHEFDIAGFVAVPEPSTYALFSLGAAVLFWVSKRSSAK